jgi:acyl-CoA synthetase (AMP-forming)/AMP-acid ligase II
VAAPWRLLETIERFRCTLAWLPNFALQHIVNTLPDDRRFDLSSMRAIVSCSEMCRPETFERFAEALASHGFRPEQLAASYGMAETVMGVTQTPPGRAPRVVERDGVRRLSCGPFLDGVGARISSEGEIEIDTRGDTVFRGYFQNAAASQEVLDDGWYRTGDLGFIQDGELFLTGRIKDVLIVHGRNYYAHDIEAIAGSVAGIKPGRAVVFAIENADVGSEDAVCIAETPASRAGHAALQRAVKQAVFDRLGLTLRTVSLVEPGWIVKTTSGKISRAENRDRWLTRTAGPNP